MSGRAELPLIGPEGTPMDHGEEVVFDAPILDKMGDFRLVPVVGDRILLIGKWRKANPVDEEEVKDAVRFLHEPRTGTSSDDPWAHRSKGMRCSTCMFYVKKEAANLEELVPEVGRCRRRAPTMGGYPAVFPHDWCGDHKLDETKL